MSEVLRIADQLTRALEGDAWHGPSLREALSDVEVATAARRPAGAHSIWEIVLHVTSWAHEVRRRLDEGEVRELPPGDDWPAVGEASDASWRAALDALDRAHDRLRRSIARLDPDRLDAPVGDWTVYITLHGIVQHDVYHAGQIVLLKKLMLARAPDSTA